MLNFEELKKVEEQKKITKRGYNVRITDSNYEKLKELSKEQDISITKLVNYMISQCLKEVEL